MLLPERDQSIPGLDHGRTIGRSFCGPGDSQLDRFIFQLSAQRDYESLPPGDCCGCHSPGTTGGLVPRWALVPDVDEYRSHALKLVECKNQWPVGELSRPAQCYQIGRAHV